MQREQVTFREQVAGPDSQWDFCIQTQGSCPGCGVSIRNLLSSLPFFYLIVANCDELWSRMPLTESPRCVWSWTSPLTSHGRWGDEDSIS
jgi:hypothetical protein